MIKNNCKEIEDVCNEINIWNKKESREALKCSPNLKIKNN